MPIDEPCVVHYEYTYTGDLIQVALAKAGISSSRLSGAKDELAIWQSGDSQVLVGQNLASSEGIDLTRACYGFIYTVPLSPVVWPQLLKRMHRPGQTRPVVYTHIVMERTVDVRAYFAQRAKQTMVDWLREAVAEAKAAGVGKRTADDLLERINLGSETLGDRLFTPADGW